MPTRFQEPIRAWLAVICRAPDALAVAVVAIMCLTCSAAYLFGYSGLGGHGTGSAPSNFSAAISLAFGQGLQRPLPTPAIEAFIAQDVDYLLPEQMPPPAPDYIVSPWDSAHRYLLTYVSWVWRLFGVSWHTFKIALIPPFIAAGVLAYALFRLGAAPVWSAAGAIVLMIAPAMIEAHFCLRDFVKAPFIYAVLFATGYLIRFPVTSGRLFAAAAAGGFALGLGYGFRQDLLMFVPVLLAGILFGAHGPGIRISHRVAAVVLAAAVSLGTASPIVSQVVREEGAQGNHDLLMGWTRLAFEQLQLERGSYELFYEHHDDFPYALRQYRMKYAHQAIFPQPFESWRDSEEARDLLLQTAWWFPADWAVRGLAATRAALTSTNLRTGKVLPDDRPPFLEWSLNFHELLGRVLRWLAPLMALVVLFGVAMRDLPRAWLLFLLLLYATGYTSLQFALRHAFHLSILPIGLVAAAASLATVMVVRFFKRESRGRKREAIPLRRLLLVGTHAAAAVLMIALPYALLARVQDAHMRQMLEAYRHAPREPFETATEDLNGWVMHRHRTSSAPEPLEHLDATWTFDGASPETLALARFIAAAAAPWTPRITEIALTFEGAESSFPIFLDYLDTPGIPQFERELRIVPPADGSRFTYFFPAWDSPLAFDPVRAVFSGFGLRPEDAAKLIAVEQVKQAWRLPLPLNITVPERSEDFQPRNTLGKWLAE